MTVARRLNPALLSSATGEWGTPPDFYAAQDALFQFTVDACATRANAKHPRFWNLADNGLAQSWEGETVWCNPPYGAEVSQWVARARDAAVQERAIACLLVAARPDTQWWRRYVLQEDHHVGRLRASFYVPETGVWWLRWDGLTTGIRFWPERLRFVGMRDDSAPFPSALVWHASPNRRPPAGAQVAGSMLWRWPR